MTTGNGHHTITGQQASDLLMAGDPPPRAATGPFKKGAPANYKAGWSPLPLGISVGSTIGSVPTGYSGWDGAYPDVATLRGWIKRYAGADLVLRMSPTVIGLDVDTYTIERNGKKITKDGTATLTRLVKKLGDLPDTYISTSRYPEDQESGIRFFRVPEGAVFISGLDGIDVIQAHHRFARVWPSASEKNGRVKRWYSEQPDGSWTELPEGSVPAPDALPDLPDAWLSELAYQGVAGTTVRGTREQVADFEGEYCRGSRMGVLDRVLDGMRNPVKARHQTGYDQACKIARDAMAGLYPADSGFDALDEIFHAVKPDAREGEFDELVRDAVARVLKDEPEEADSGEPDDANAFLMDRPRPSGSRAAGAPGGAGDGPPKAAVIERTPAFLPDGFWSTRPELAHIRAAAHASFVDPGAVLYGVLTRIASLLPGDLRVVTGMMESASLNLFAALVAPSGVGKSGSSKVAARLVPVLAALGPMDDGQPRYFERAPIGTGEGLVESFMGHRDQTDGEGRSTRVRGQARHNASFYVDEGKTITTLMVKREGSTLGPVFRTAWTGETIGQQNGSAERTRNVSNYSLGVLIGFQPSTALPMLEGAEEGTPQRLVWCKLGGGDIPRTAPEHPGRLWGENTLCDLLGLDPFNSSENLLGPERAESTVTMCEALRTQLWDERYLIQTGATEVDQMDSQRPVTMIKLSGLLCILAGRTQITEDDWHLAATLWATSCAVRDELLEARRVAGLRKRTEEREAKVADAVAVKGAVNDEEVSRDRVARGVLRKVTRVNPASVTRKDLVNSIASADRKGGAGQRAIDYAVSKGWIIEDDGLFTLPQG